MFFFLSEQINAEALWGTAASDGWRASSAPRSDWPRMQFYLSMSQTKFKMNTITISKSAML